MTSTLHVCGRFGLAWELEMGGGAPQLVGKPGLGPVASVLGVVAFGEGVCYFLGPSC